MRTISPTHPAFRQYRRAWHPGGGHFFTFNMLQHRGDDLLTHRTGLLRDVIRAVSGASGLRAFHRGEA
jgi:hypothetical protein